MFLKLNEHKAQPKLEAIGEFIVALVKYCANDAGTAFELPPFKRAYPKDEKWLLNHPTFVSAMEALYRLDPAQRLAGYNAVSRDTHFHTFTMQGQEYHFAFPKLPSNIQDTLGQLYKFFYNQFRSDIKISVLAGDTLNRIMSP